MIRGFFGKLKKAIRFIFKLPVLFYKKFISPLKPPCCRFTPTCSQYALEALETHGVFKGLALSFWRILRCNPFCKAGYDPVPPKKIIIKTDNKSK